MLHRYKGVYFSFMVCFLSIVCLGYVYCKTELTSGRRTSVAWYAACRGNPHHDVTHSSPSCSVPVLNSSLRQTFILSLFLIFVALVYSSVRHCVMLPQICISLKFRPIVNTNRTQNHSCISDIVTGGALAK